MKEYIISNIREFNTSEAYFGDASINNDFITIPYINVSLLKQHSFNLSKNQIYLDFCFLQIIRYEYISIFERGILKNNLSKYDPQKSEYFGGYFVGSSSMIDNEIEVQARDILLIIPKEVRISSNMWMPDLKNFKGKGNIKEDEIIPFFKRVPEIKKVIFEF